MHHFGIKTININNSKVISVNLRINNSIFALRVLEKYEIDHKINWNKKYILIEKLFLKERNYCFFISKVSRALKEIKIQEIEEKYSTWGMTRDQIEDINFSIDLDEEIYGF